MFLRSPRALPQNHRIDLVGRKLQDHLVQHHAPGILGAPPRSTKQLCIEHSRGWINPFHKPGMFPLSSDSAAWPTGAVPAWPWAMPLHATGKRETKLQAPLLTCFTADGPCLTFSASSMTSTPLYQICANKNQHDKTLPGMEIATGFRALAGFIVPDSAIHTLPLGFHCSVLTDHASG